jgi:SAM-dependent methyltransferase
MLQLTDKRNFKKLLAPLIKVRKYAKLKKTFKAFKKLSDECGARFPVTWDNIFFIAGDDTSNTTFDAHYVYHPAWAARILAETKPEFHVDISSTLHFCSIVSAFIPVHFYDYRPARLELSNLTSEQADLLSLPFEDGSIESISCMHTVEHVGLGRYGDPLDPDGDLKAISELKRVTALGGDLLFVVPIGTAKIAFNAHRIYNYAQILEYFGNEFELRDFFLIPDTAVTHGVLHHATEEDADAQTYGCGCFWFRKK